VEVHVCWDRAQGGPDAASSLTFAELRQLVEARNAMQTLQQASGEWSRPAHAHLYEPSWVKENGQWTVKKTGGVGVPASQPCPSGETPRPGEAA
jgi:hypothetical protein